MSCPALHQGQPHACPVFQAYGFSFHPQIPLELPLFMQGSDFGIYRRHQPWCKVPGIYCYHAEFLSILVDCAGFALESPQQHPCLAWTHRKVWPCGPPSWGYKMIYFCCGNNISLFTKCVPPIIENLQLVRQTHFCADGRHHGDLQWQAVCPAINGNVKTH